MVTKEDLQERYLKLDIIDLLEITAHREDYTELAVTTALEELKKREVPQSEIKNYISPISNAPDETLLKNYRVDLNLLQKIIFYVVWIPKIRSFFNFNFYSDGYVLKSQQSNYYSILGFICFSISFATSDYHHAMLLLWGSAFVICYLYDVNFNKERQINAMNEKIAKGKDLWAI